MLAALAPHLLVDTLLLRLLDAFDGIVLDRLLLPAFIHHRVHALADGLVDTASMACIQLASQKRKNVMLVMGRVLVVVHGRDCTGVTVTSALYTYSLRHCS